MNLSLIRADFFRRARYAASPPTAITTRANAFANEVHRELLAVPGIAKLRDGVLPITATANQARLGLPPIVGRIQAITDRSNNHRLVQVPLSDLRWQDPSQAFTGGYPLRYAVTGQQEVAIQPTISGTGLWAASSSVADTQGVRVEAVRLGGYLYEPASTPLVGTTRVAIGGTAAVTDYMAVERFYLGTTAASGYVMLYDAATSGNELARIPIGQTFARYLSVEWWPIPTADATLYVDFTRTIPELVNDTDEPLLPSDHHEVIVRGMLVREYEFLDDSRKVGADIDYKRAQNALKSWVLNDGDKLSSLRQTPVRWSRLGAGFPGERWP